MIYMHTASHSICLTITLKQHKHSSVTQISADADLQIAISYTAFFFSTLAMSKDFGTEE